MNQVYLLTTGSRANGDDWSLVSIHRTREGAETARQIYEKPIQRKDGSLYSLKMEIEPWIILN